MSEASAPSAGVPSAGDPSADAPKSAAARLFDIRSLIGGLFLLYGIMLTVAGFSTSQRVTTLEAERTFSGRPEQIF